MNGEAHERVRLLYVAATRARERLVIGWSRKLAAAPEPENAKSLADLLTTRGDPRVRARAAIAGGGAFTDGHGVLWRALAWQAAPPLPRAEITLHAIDPARVLRDEQFLRTMRSAAEAREARTWHATASEFAHATSEEREATLTRDAEAAEEPATAHAAEPPDRERRIAMAAGTAVHAALEHARLDAEPHEIAAEGETALAAALAGLEPASECAAAAQRARAIWQRVCAGELLARLRVLAPCIIARELPVLLAPSELPATGDAPVGFISGAIDLLYQDEAGEYVVADYKTDDMSGEAKLREKTAHYAPQGAAYTRAVQLALGLTAPPRFELWFLQADERVTLA